MQKLILVLLSVFMALSVKAQSLSDIYQEIASQPENEETFLIKSRIYLYKQLLGGNKQNVQAILSLYAEKRKSAIFLQPTEYTLVCYWLQQYDAVIRHIN